MDLQTVLDSIKEKERMETLADSDQLLLGELIIIFENVDHEKPVLFDDGEHCPVGVGSWRGSYSELAIRHEEADDENVLTAGEFHSVLDDADGSEFRGYKGGDYRMSSSTPVWVANRGTSGGFEHRSQGVVEVTEYDDSVVIETGEVDLY